MGTREITSFAVSWQDDSQSTIFPAPSRVRVRAYDRLLATSRVVNESVRRHTILQKPITHHHRELLLLCDSSFFCSRLHSCVFLVDKDDESIRHSTVITTTGCRHTNPSQDNPSPTPVYVLFHII
jgi:hypothetical protein